MEAIQQTVESFFKPKDKEERCVESTGSPPMGQMASRRASEPVNDSNGAAGDATTHPTTINHTIRAGEAPQVRTRPVDPRAQCQRPPSRTARHTRL